MKEISVNEYGGIYAASFVSNSISDINYQKYDMAIITSSWDPRCLNITELNLSNFPTSILILFDDKDENGLREKHDRRLEEYLSERSEEIIKIGGLSTDVDNIFIKIYEKLVTKCVDHGRPLNILFDLSVCPRFISLSLLARGINLGLIKSIDFLYGECRYPDRKSGMIGVTEVIFTEGNWETKPVDHLLGQYEPGYRSMFTVSIGFEGNKTLRVVNSEDPDHVRLLVPDPGFTESYISRSLEANSELIKYADIGQEDMIKEHAGDAVGVWIKLDTDIKQGIAYSSNHSYICAGSKPHSLGMALSALTNQGISLLYSLPKEHKYIDIIPTHKYWFYRVKSLTAPSI